MSDDLPMVFTIRGIISSGIPRRSSCSFDQHFSSTLYPSAPSRHCSPVNKHILCRKTCKMCQYIRCIMNKLRAVFFKSFYIRLKTSGQTWQGTYSLLPDYLFRFPKKCLNPSYLRDLHHPLYVNQDN